MSRIISVHEYNLKQDVEVDEFERAVSQARGSGLLDLPGLETFYFIKGVRGDRTGRYAIVWIYESRDAWEALWGGEGDPLPAEKYPQNWTTWEQEVLAQYLDRDPDRIAFTAYMECGSPDVLNLP